MIVRLSVQSSSILNFLKKLAIFEKTEINVNIKINIILSKQVHENYRCDHSERDYQDTLVPFLISSLILFGPR